MKRSRSGSRSGAKKPATTTKFRYELVRYNEHGELFDLNEQELAAFKGKHPQFASQYLDKPPEEKEMTWQSQCGRMLESLMHTKAAAWFLVVEHRATIPYNAARAASAHSVPHGQGAAREMGKMGGMVGPAL